MPKGSDFQQTALSESKVTAPRSNPSNNTILPAQITQNANFSDIFPFEFKANKSPFLLSNVAVNEQKVITAMYTKATVEKKATQEDVYQMKEAEYIEYTMKLARFDYEDKVETYNQIANYTYPTKEAQIQ
ncbi:hypothetical protein G9A89_020810 [Geosiphon pyriformis]|nr:hypothetical protein G9A89_020810 [Geosiphon pyriformis]